MNNVVFHTTDWGQSMSACYICQGQRTGMCNCKLTFDNPKTNTIHVYWYHRECVADHLLAQITEDQHRDEINNQRQGFECILCGHGAHGPICSASPWCTVCNGSTERLADELEDIHFDQVSNLMNGGKLTAKEILLKAWRDIGQDYNVSGYFISNYRAKLKRVLNHLNTINV